MPEQPEVNEGQELVQCPNCLGYFTRQLENVDELPEDAIERHLCWIGGTRPQMSVPPGE